jgi:methionine-rich copper-binding protein CopC
MIRTARLAVLAAFLLAAFARPGTARDTASSSTRPQASGDRHRSPKRLVIRFNSRLEKRLCSVTLVGPQQGGVLLVRQEDDAPPDTLIYPLPALKPGPYRAKWKVLAADGHVTEGAIVFTVEGGAAAK